MCKISFLLMTKYVFICSFVFIKSSFDGHLSYLSTIMNNIAVNSSAQVSMSSCFRYLVYISESRIDRYFIIGKVF